MIQPGDVEQLAAEGRANFGKLLGLLVVVMFGCCCWGVVWRRELVRSRLTPNETNRTAEGEVPVTEIAQQVTLRVGPQ